MIDSRAETRTLLRWILVVAAVLALFWLVSSVAEWPRTDFGRRTRLLPPVNTSFDPRWTWMGLISLGSVAGFAAVSFWLARTKNRIRPSVLLAGLVVFLFLLSAAVVAVRGQPAGFVRQIRPGHPVQYTADVPAVYERGVGVFVREFPSFIAGEANSIHTITHPPGPVVLLAALGRMWPDRLIPRALILMLLSSLTVVPTWFIARRLAGERAALFAAVLFCVVPSVVLHAATSIDGAMTLVVVTCGAVLLWGLDEQIRLAPPVLAGTILAFGMFFTYACAFIAVFGALHALSTRPWRSAVRILLLTGLGGLLGVVLMWLTIGFDVIASYAATDQRLRVAADTRPVFRPLLYWVLGNPGGWLIMAGIPVAGLALRTLWRNRPRWLLAFIAPLALYYVLPVEITGLIPGEVERTLLFAYAIGATAAAVGLTHLDPEKQPRWLAGCVAVSGSQLVAFEAVLLFVW